MISDYQLAVVLTVLVRQFSRSIPAVLDEVAQTPFDDQVELESLVQHSQQLVTEIPSSPPIPTTPSLDIGVRHESLGAKVGRHMGVGGSRLRGTMSTVTVAVQGVGRRDSVRSTTEALRQHAEPLAANALNTIRGDLHPGHPDWAALPIGHRADWWAARVGTLAAALASLPALTGRGAKLVRVTPLLGRAAEAVTVCAVSRECGLLDEASTVHVISRVVFVRALDDGAVQAALTASLPSVDDIQFDNLELRALAAVGSPGRALRQLRLLRSSLASLRSVEALLGDSQRRGPWWLRTAANVPVAGALAVFVDVRRGMTEAAHETVTMLVGPPR